MFALSTDPLMFSGKLEHFQTYAFLGLFVMLVMTSSERGKPKNIKTRA